MILGKTQIDVEAIKEEDNEVYEYDIYKEIRELVIAARGCNYLRSILNA